MSAHCLNCLEPELSPLGLITLSNGLCDCCREHLEKIKLVEQEIILENLLELDS